MINPLISGYLAEIEDRIEAPYSGAVIIVLISLLVAAYLAALSFIIYIPGLS